MKIGDGVYFGDGVWIIQAIMDKRVWIRPLHQGDIPTAPFYQIETHNQDGSPRLSLGLCETKPAQPEKPQEPPARKHARKQQPGEQLSLFSGVGEGVGL